LSTLHGDTISSVRDRRPRSRALTTDASNRSALAPLSLSPSARHVWPTVNGSRRPHERGQQAEQPADDDEGDTPAAHPGNASMATTAPMPAARPRTQAAWSRQAWATLGEGSEGAPAPKLGRELTDKQFA